MNREQVKRLLPVIQAYADGKEIQWRHMPCDDWSPCILSTISESFEYRIKPREPREFWVSDHDNGKYRYTYDEEPPARQFDQRQNVSIFKVREIIEEEAQS